MLGNLLSNRVIQAGLVFFLLVVGGIWLYSWHGQRTTESELARHDAFLQQLKKQNETPTTAGTSDTSTADNALSVPQQGTIIETSPISIEKTDAAEGSSKTRGNEDSVRVDTDILLEESPQEAAIAARLSPFGLGIFPEVPSDYPDPNVWERIERAAHDPVGGKKLELLIRVRIKLWEQGTKTIGASYAAGIDRIYPNIPNVAYVEWAYIDEPDGTRSRYAAVVSGGIGPEYEEYFDKGEVPPGVTVIPYDEAGINPYTFLEFKYE